jgi:membrane protease YdiL (CAAX protease family)
MTRPSPNRQMAMPTSAPPQSGTIGGAIRRHPLLSYSVIAYAGSWVVWATFILSQDGTGALSFNAPLSFFVTISIGTFTGPTVAAFIVTAACEGREGVGRLIARILQWRVGIVWYLFVFLGLPAIQTLGSIALPGVLESATPIDFWPELAATAVFFFYPALLAGPLGEEIGWRGVAMPRLQARFGPLHASLILGLLWAFWHAPIWFSGQWTVLTLPNVAVYVFWIIAVTFIFTWVFNNTRGSVLIAILLHGSMDVFPNTFLLPHLPRLTELTASGALTMYFGLALGFGAFAVLLILLTRARLGVQRNPSTSTA